MLVPGGSYAPLFGEPPKKTTASEVRQEALPPVQVASFFLSRHLITKAEYLQFVQEHPRWRRSQVKRLFADSGYLKSWAADLEFSGKPQQPATEVSWFAAKAYCQSIGARLPSTQEWEYAARANEAKADALGDDAFVSRILNWYAAHETQLGEVGGWKNFYGVYDMHGLVWEWVSDFNSALITGESRADARAERNLFCAGGAMFASEKQKRNYAAFMRFAFRSSLEGKFSLPQLGFRCAKDAREGGNS